MGSSNGLVSSCTKPLAALKLIKIYDTEIMYPFPKFVRATVEVWGRINNLGVYDTENMYQFINFSGLREEV